MESSVVHHGRSALDSAIDVAMVQPNTMACCMAHNTGPWTVSWYSPWTNRRRWHGPWHRPWSTPMLMYVTSWRDSPCALSACWFWFRFSSLSFCFIFVCIQFLSFFILFFAFFKPSLSGVRMYHSSVPGVISLQMIRNSTPQLAIVPFPLRTGIAVNVLWNLFSSIGTFFLGRFCDHGLDFRKQANVRISSCSAYRSLSYPVWWHDIALSTPCDP